MMERDRIQNWQGKVIGFIDTDTVTGDKIVRDFYGRILGRYKKSVNMTFDFYGRRVARGDRVMMFLQDK